MLDELEKTSKIVRKTAKRVFKVGKIIHKMIMYASQINITNFYRILKFLIKKKQPLYYTHSYSTLLSTQQSFYFYTKKVQI